MLDSMANLKSSKHYSAKWSIDWFRLMTTGRWSDRKPRRPSEESFGTERWSWNGSHTAANQDVAGDAICLGHNSWSTRCNNLQWALRRKLPVTIIRLLKLDPRGSTPRFLMDAWNLLQTWQKEVSTTSHFNLRISAPMALSLPFQKSQQYCPARVPPF